MVNEGAPQAEVAKAELERRGTIMPEMEISGHALDRASQRLLSVWVGTRKPDEGLYSWLARNAKEAKEKGQEVSPGVYLLGSTKYVFEMDCEWPVLKTVLGRDGKE